MPARLTDSGNEPIASRAGFGGSCMLDQKAAIKHACLTCHGEGRARNPRHVFLGALLICGGILAKFPWPATTRIFLRFAENTEALGLPVWFAPAISWIISAVPIVFGLAFLLAWILRDTCRACCGEGRAPEPFVFGGI